MEKEKEAISKSKYGNNIYNIQSQSGKRETSKLFRRNTKMTQEEFWAIIHSTLAAENQEEQRVLIKDRLSTRSQIEILSFISILIELLGKSHDWSLRAAKSIPKVYYPNELIGLRLLLISKGQAVFEEALTDPENMILLTQRDNENQLRFYELMSAAFEVYNKKTKAAVEEVTALEAAYFESRSQGRNRGQF